MKQTESLNTTAATLSAETLVQQCLKGDTQAYRLLYNRYSAAMYNTALRIVNRTDDAEDVLQESFIDAFAQLARFEGRSTFGAWLKQIVVNKSISYLRKKRVFMADIDDHAHSIADEQPIDDSGFYYSVDTIKQAVQQLPDGYRTVLSLYLFEEYKQEEIAQMLNISHGTVRTQYMRAKNKLVNVLKEGAYHEQ
ncbi:MAG: RNA polymerase sigma factor [Chitinophagaceae bacterium]|jgi:RNA polymerase sigma factor (sigma-70 family)|nr:RNA polymerase sigma factor [Chitinophagaceae bacterium]